MASMSGLHVTGTLRLPRCWITSSSGDGEGLMYDAGRFILMFHKPPRNRALIGVNASPGGKKIDKS